MIRIQTAKPAKSLIVSHAQIKMSVPSVFKGFSVYMLGIICPKITRSVYFVLSRYKIVTIARCLRRALCYAMFVKVGFTWSIILARINVCKIALYAKTLQFARLAIIITAQMGTIQSNAHIVDLVHCFVQLIHQQEIF